MVKEKQKNPDDLKEFGKIYFYFIVFFLFFLLFTFVSDNVLFEIFLSCVSTWIIGRLRGD